MSLRFPVVKVEDHDGGDHTAGHHEHDAVEVSPCNKYVMIVQVEIEKPPNICLSIFSPIKGLSEVIGMISETVFRNIVRDSNIVTPPECLNNQYKERKIYA